MGTHPAAFLRPKPAAALPGVGPATARTLAHDGLHTIGALADIPLARVQRILGATTGRTVHERAHGHDPRPVTPTELPKSMSAEHAFAQAWMATWCAVTCSRPRPTWPPGCAPTGRPPEASR